MLPKHLKLTSPVEFSRTIKRGKRAGSRTMVVHVYDHKAELDPPVTIGGPRFGLIVSKAVGNAVTRHDTSRRLRAVCRDAAPTLPKAVDVVIRALPSSASADSAALRRDLDRALKKAGYLRG